MSYDDDDWDRPRRGKKPGKAVGPRPSPQRAKYIESRLAGLSPMQAARRAGYADPGKEYKQLEVHSEVVAALHAVRNDAAAKKAAVYTREKVFELIEEGLQMSISAADPMAFFKGVQEINKMQGFYAAEKHELGISPELAALQGQLSGLTDAQLLERLGGEQGIVIDGEATVLSVQENKDALLDVDGVRRLHGSGESGETGGEGESPPRSQRRKAGAKESNSTRPQRNGKAQEKARDKGASGGKARR